ncbi:MAG: 4a-hydroxytetrahydrobiopterin dehydratase [Opitutales bacterium]|nr:4a-hydroxytetrahydrobiopterin dehydratase [Opitutales bacterium]
MSHPLSDSEIEVALSGLPGWSRDGDQLAKTYTFGSFREAVSFITRIAFEAEDMNHHPDLANVYNKVSIALSTHDTGGKITEKDVKLAQKIEDISWV